MISRFCYIRFGEIPEIGFSKNWLTGKLEEGVSCYEAIERDNAYLVIIPSLKESTCVSLASILDRPMLEITGKLIGYGSENEPLLINPTIVKEVFQERNISNYG